MDTIDGSSRHNSDTKGIITLSSMIATDFLSLPKSTTET
jgi:hypothetical protein